MPRPRPLHLAAVLCLGSWHTMIAAAATLEVGPGKRFQRIEDANAKARPGDVVLVHPLPDGKPYEMPAVFVTVPNLTFRGVAGPAGQRVRISGAGFDYSGVGRVPRAVFQFNPEADGGTLDGFELSGAHNASHNGAGVRIQQANDVTIRNCEIHRNDMGIMSNGDGTTAAGTNQLIERCVIHHNGNRDEPGQNHNLYLGGAGVTLIGCEVHSSLTGHNVKSRAHFTAVIACHIHHSNNREFDLVDAAETALPDSDALLAGNLIVKDPACQGNRAVIHFGQDGGKPHAGTLTLLNNTIVTPFVSPVVDLSAAAARARLTNNLVSDGGSGQRRMILVATRQATADGTTATGTHNRLAAGFDPLPAGFPAAENSTGRDMPPFPDASHGDFRLSAAAAKLAGQGATGVAIGVPDIRLPAAAGFRAGKFTLGWQYRAPASAEPRTDHGATLGGFACRPQP